MEVLQAVGCLFYDGTHDSFLSVNASRREYRQPLIVLQLICFAQILQDSKKRPLRHEGTDDPELVFDAETAVAAQNVPVIAQFHRQHFPPYVDYIWRRTF